MKGTNHKISSLSNLINAHKHTSRITVFMEKSNYAYYGLKSASQPNHKHYLLQATVNINFSEHNAGFVVGV